MEKSTQDSCTLYEVYDKRTGQAITRKHDGRPVQFNTLTIATLFVNESASELGKNFDIQKGSELAIRPISSEQVKP